MEKTRQLSFLMLVLTLVSCKSSWIKINERTTEKITQNGILIDQFEDVKSEHYYFKSKLYKYRKFRVLKSEFFVDTLMQSKSEFYLKDSSIIQYKYAGLDVVVNPKNEKAYAKISEQFYYFKNEENGVIKEREIEITSFGESKKAEEELKQKRFKQRETTEKEKLKIKEEVQQQLLSQLPKTSKLRFQKISTTPREPFLTKLLWNGKNPSSPKASS